MAAEPNNKYSEVVRVMRGIVPDEDTIQQDLDRLIQREGRRLTLDFAQLKREYDYLLD